MQYIRSGSKFLRQSWLKNQSCKIHSICNVYRPKPPIPLMQQQQQHQSPRTGNLGVLLLCQARNVQTKPKFPELLYFPRVIRWMNNKLKLKWLSKRWDPDFSEGAFIYGSTQAICRVTEIIHTEKTDELEGIMSKEAKQKLEVDMNSKLMMPQKKVIALRPPDIKLLVPIKVKLFRKGEGRYCSVMLKTLAMKWQDQGSMLNLVLIVIESEFYRDYSVGAKPEWIITLFDVVQCVTLQTKTPA